LFCTKCGANNTANARYCSHCGTAMLLARNPNFLVKHWRGNYSLGISYWVIGTLLTAVVIAITTAFGSSDLSRELEPRISGAITLVLYGFLMVMTVWQFVGIWRSASKHGERGGKPFWAGLVKVLVVLGVLRMAGEFITQDISILSENAKLLVGIDDTPAYQIRLLRSGTELELAGGMPFGTTDAIEKILDASPAIQITHLNSRGGRINEAHRLYKTIKERNLSTYTSADCVSACSIAFLAGRERYLGESGRLGFHSSSIGELGGEVLDGLNDDVRQLMRAHGAPESFINRALSTPPDDMWYPTKEELLEAGIIDSVVDSRYFGLSGVTQWRDAQKLESELLAIPFYSALAQYDQQSYAELRNILISGIQGGRAEIGIQDDIRSVFLGQLVPVYLTVAPDEALIRYWRSQMAEIDYLAKLNPQLCVDFVFPEFAESEPDLQRLLPKELLAEDMAALASVVKGVAVNPQGHLWNEAVQADLDLAMIRVEQRFPQAMDVFQSPERYRSDPESLCGAISALYSEILAIPDISRSGPILRYMLSE